MADREYMNKYIFAITGGSGAGKSTVSNGFRRLGVYVSDADKAARAVTVKGSKCLDELRFWFGEQIINRDGSLDRAALAAIAFSDAESLRRLNEITHKYIFEYIKEELNGAEAGICAIDGAVIIGSPVMSICSKVVAVTAGRDIRIERIKKRDGISQQLAEKRINSQKDDRFYMDHADYIIENNNDENRLGEQIEFIYNKIKTEAEAVSAD